MARDVLVIGAGVVGLAVARALALAGDQVLVAEATGQIGSGVSSRNSEVLHAGLYYKPGSLKARVCVAGRAQLVTYCEARSVPYALCGKLVVATAEDQVPALRALEEKATANGVRTAWLTAQEAQALEPALNCVAALHSPDTGIVDSHSLMLALQADLEAAGGQVAFASPVVGGILGQAGAPHVVRIGGDDTSEWTFDVVVNAAALSAVSVAASFEGPRSLGFLWRGSQKVITVRSQVKHLSNT